MVLGLAQRPDRARSLTLSTGTMLEAMGFVQLTAGPLCFLYNDQPRSLGGTPQAASCSCALSEDRKSVV